MTYRTPLRVTGIGAVSNAGHTSAHLWDAMCTSASSTTVVDDKDLVAPVLDMFLAAPVPVVEHSAAEFGIAAAREALSQAADGGFEAEGRRLAVVVGTGMGEAAGHDARRGQGERHVSGSIFTTAERIAAAVGATGPVVSISNACAAGAYAMGHAADLLWAGEADAVLVVGAEAYSRVAVACFNRMNALDGEGCRPFTEERAGTLFGEGGGAVLLERDSSCTTPVAWLLGSAFSCDAAHLTAPEEGAAQIQRTFDEAVTEAGVSTVDAVVPHGTGTRLNDAVEAELLSSRVPDAAWFNLKALLGHTGGASAVLSVVAACLIATYGKTPGNPESGALMPQATAGVGLSERAIGGVIAVNAYAFGGNNATLVLGKERP